MFNVGDRVKVIGSSCEYEQCKYCRSRFGAIAKIKSIEQDHAYLDDEAGPIEYKYLELIRDKTPLPLPG